MWVIRRSCRFAFGIHFQFIANYYSTYVSVCIRTYMQFEYIMYSKDRTAHRKNIESSNPNRRIRRLRRRNVIRFYDFDSNARASLIYSDRRTNKHARSVIVCMPVCVYTCCIRWSRRYSTLWSIHIWAAYSSVGIKYIAYHPTERSKRERERLNFKLRWVGFAHIKTRTRRYAVDVHKQATRASKRVHVTFVHVACARKP